jgi:exo-1,4-beta-D-glucosaminidase
VNLINSWNKQFSGLKAQATIYNLDGTKKYSNTVATTVGADGVQKCFVLPAVSGLSTTYFLKLELKDAAGKVKDINWYWLSTKPDVLNWKKSKWYTTPQTSYTDFSALQNIGKTALRVSYQTAKGADSTAHTVTIANTGKTVAFQVHLRALKGKDGDDILPVIFSDNYLELAPGETRVIHCKYADKDAAHAEPYFLTSAWNIDMAASKAEKESGFGEEWVK